MDQKQFEKYQNDRYQDQVIWYSHQASKNKKFYTYFQWGVIVLSATIPVLVIALSPTWRWLTAIVAMILAIGTAGLKSFKFQENWIGYRTISETLKKEEHYYDAEIDEYADVEDKEALFVQRVESLISRENSLWVTTHQRGEGEENKLTNRGFGH